MMDENIGEKNIDERKQRILHALIKDYVDTGEPVGSRTIAKKYDLGVSAATIRNEMADLEEMGFIHQPHTSAGRVPSDKGYRYYVDCLMAPNEKILSDDEQHFVQEFFADQVAELDSLFQRSCELLSRLTNYTAMIVQPKMPTGVLARLNLLRISEEQILAIMITNDGKIIKKTFAVPKEFANDNLQDFEAMLQNRLQGLTIAQVTEQIMQEITHQLIHQQSLIKQSIKMMEGMLLGEEVNDKVLINGTLNLLTQPEFQDVGKVRQLLLALEVDDVVKQLLITKDTKTGTMVYIGDELQSQGMDVCSVVTTPYYVNGEKVGNIGVLGPTRMPYPKVIALVEQISQEVSDKMAKAKKDKTDSENVE